MDVLISVFQVTCFIKQTKPDSWIVFISMIYVTVPRAAKGVKVKIVRHHFNYFVPEKLKKSVMRKLLN